MPVVGFKKWGPWLRSKKNEPGKPRFFQCFGVLGGNGSSQQELQVSGAFFGAHCENEPLDNTFGVFKVILCCQGSSGCEARVCCGTVRMPKMRGKWGFCTADQKKTASYQKMGCPKNGPNFFLAKAIGKFVFLAFAPRF